MKIVVGITGASGSIYGVRLIEVLRRAGHEVHAVVTQSGWQVLDYECGVSRESLAKQVNVLYDVENISAAIASGIIPYGCHGGGALLDETAGSIAHGISDNLLTRAADVALKEGRPLILVPRETPMHAIHLENLLKLAQTGARIMPACPGFYHRPQTLDDLVDMMVGKICDMLGVEHQLFARWQG
ncbi:MAG: UbiX family flavin prenyltransferase [Selenomonas sp.]|jgi:4-hydroxy-3-polyprenylbenzoate decarboxylase|nr:UbiX family flavin prenyltransferase [Selenomonas sp.]